MLDKEESERLIKLSQQGDKDATTTLIEEHSPLVKSIVRRFRGRGAEYDDLFQLGSIGLLKAIRNFSCEYAVCFSTYAVSMIMGEIKRHLRDDGYVKVSRAIKTLAYKMNYYVEQVKAQNGTAPSIEEVALHFNVDPQEAVFAMDSARAPVSIYEKGDDDRSLTVGDKIADKRTVDDTVDRLIIKDAIEKLDDRERKIVYLRFYKDRTQSEVAKELNVSQVQVSRLESKIIAKIRKEFVEEEEKPTQRAKRQSAPKQKE